LWWYNQRLALRWYLLPSCKKFCTLSTYINEEILVVNIVKKKRNLNGAPIITWASFFIQAAHYVRFFWQVFPLSFKILRQTIRKGIRIRNYLERQMGLFIFLCMQQEWKWKMKESYIFFVKLLFLDLLFRLFQNQIWNMDVQRIFFPLKLNLIL